MTEVNGVTGNEIDEKKELLELIAAIQPIAITGVKIAKDGKISFGDLKYVGELLGSFNAIKDGVVGLKDLNLKDLEANDLQVLGAAAFDMIKSVIAAYKAE